MISHLLPAFLWCYGFAGLACESIDTPPPNLVDLQTLYNMIALGRAWIQAGGAFFFLIEGAKH